ncbi:MAG TPA: class I fructose-bisphosphate aldolase [Actinomycetota bacterium]|jgi:fructose-bisphosphate aldolase class I|nr:class I fructose-bisphosphate aldolase [Actinomycetota bacterium]
MSHHAHLEEIARALVAPGKGILAADESSGTIKKRFDSIGLESTEENRRAYRDMLFTTKGLGEFISGVILYDETIRQGLPDGTPFSKVLEQGGMIPGIKVDTGSKKLAAFPGEEVTEGLDGLRDRLAEYVKLGAQFTKWRAVINIGDGIPTRFGIDANAHALARFAALTQEAGMVPIVEPEVMMTGDHAIGRCYDVSEATLIALFDQLYAHSVVLEGLLLKTNMVLSGQDCATQASPEDVARETIRCFRNSVPTAVPGIVFLSGGQDDVPATVHLNEMNKMGPHPWELSFSYGRALQAPALKAWSGQDVNVEAGQQELLHRARCNGAARFGKYTKKMEEAA